MAKAYWIARVDVHDREKYQDYVRANAAAFARYKGRFLVRGGKAESVEGTARARNVVVEFPDYESALTCWHSPEYAAAKRFREGVATGDFVIVEGYEGPQPSAD